MLSSLPPWTYSALMLLAVCLSAVIFRVTGRSLALTPSQRGAVLLGAFSGSFIAARLPFLWGDMTALCTVEGWLGNGKTILFGLAGGYVGVEFAKWCAGVRVSTGDSFAVPVAVGIAIGRVACFYGGCCFGTPTSLPWGVDFGDGVPRHPTQLFESIFHLLMVIPLLICLRQCWFKGRLIRLYFLAYVGYRFLTEFIRPEPIFAAGLTWYQWACLGLAALLIWIDVISFPHRAAHRESKGPTESSPPRNEGPAPS